MPYTQVMSARLLVLGLLLGATLVASGCASGASSLARFPEIAPAAGEPAPDVELRDLAGNRVALAELLGERPVVIQLGSYTCPVFRYRRFGMAKLHRDYGDRVRFVVVYTREAHPVGTKSPYSEGEWDTWVNRVTGVRLGEPADRAERRERAAEAHRELELPGEILVDGMDDRAWELYGRAPSPAFVVDREGKVALAQRWVRPKAIRRVLDRLLDERAPRSPAPGIRSPIRDKTRPVNTAGGRGTVTPGPWHPAASAMRALQADPPPNPTPGDSNR